MQLSGEATISIDTWRFTRANRTSSVMFAAQVSPRSEVCMLTCVDIRVRNMKTESQALATSAVRWPAGGVSRETYAHPYKRATIYMRDLRTRFLLGRKSQKAPQTQQKNSLRATFAVWHIVAMLAFSITPIHTPANDCLHVRYTVILSTTAADRRIISLPTLKKSRMHASSVRQQFVPKAPSRNIATDMPMKNHSNAKNVMLLSLTKMAWKIIYKSVTAMKASSLVQCVTSPLMVVQNNKHMITHTDERPIKREPFDPDFDNPCDANRKLNSRQQKRQFVCKICVARFAIGCNLKSHIRVHTGDRPYSCAVCDARFTQKDSVKTHMHIHNGDRPFCCGVCDARYTLRGALTWGSTVANSLWVRAVQVNIQPVLLPENSSDAQPQWRTLA